MVLFDFAVALPSETNAEKIVEEWRSLTTSPSSALHQHLFLANYESHHGQWFACLHLHQVDYFTNKGIKMAFQEVAYNFLKNTAIDFDYANFGWEAHDRVISEDVLQEIMEDDAVDYSNEDYTFESIYRGFVIHQNIHAQLRNADKFDTFKEHYYWIPYVMEHGAYDLSL